MENKDTKIEQPPNKYKQEVLKEIKVSQEAIAEFRALFRSSLEKLKQYGVSLGILDPDTPLEQVRQKLIERIGEKLNERKEERRAKTGITEEEHRKLGDRRQAI